MARNLTQFADGVQMVGLVGEDDDGGVLMGALKEDGIRTDGMVCDGTYETISKTRIIDDAVEDRVGLDQCTEGRLARLAEKRRAEEA